MKARNVATAADCIPACGAGTQIMLTATMTAATATVATCGHTPHGSSMAEPMVRTMNSSSALTGSSVTMLDSTVVTHTSVSTTNPIQIERRQRSGARDSIQYPHTRVTSCTAFT